MSWRIIKQGWEGCDSLCDTRGDTIYGYEELDGAEFITHSPHEEESDVCFRLVDGRIAWLMSADLEVVYPLADGYLREATV